MQISKKWVVALAVPVFAAMASPADAASITFANFLTTGGTITVGNTVQIGDNSGGGSAADGRIGGVIANPGGSTLITGNCSTVGCLELGTGDFVSDDATTVGDNDYLYSGLNSYIRIYGDASNDSGDSNRLLYSGRFDQGSNVRLTFDNNCNVPGGNCSASLTGTVDGGTIDSVLAAYLGVMANTDGGNATTLFLAFAGNHLGSSTVPPSGTGVGNNNSLQTFDVAQVPEPGSILLLSGGLFGVAQVIRRRRAAQAGA